MLIDTHIDELHRAAAAHRQVAAVESTGTVRSLRRMPRLGWLTGRFTAPRAARSASATVAETAGSTILTDRGAIA